MNRRVNGASRRVTVLTAALVGVAFGAGMLTGCSDNGSNEQAQRTDKASEQKQQKPKQRAGSNDQDEEETEGPELPEKLDGEHTRAVLAYYEEYNKAIKSGDTKALRALATDDCYSCKSSADLIDETYANGGHYEGRLVPVLDADGNLAKNSGDTAAVKLLFEPDGYMLYERDGGEPVEPEASYIDKQVNLEREGDQWLISEITSEDVDEK